MGSWQVARMGMLVLWVVIVGLSSAQTTHSIEAVRDDVYRLVSGNYVSVFMVTDSGIAVADPVSSESATWLKQELRERFDKPVRYVIYSHNHPDHTYGGEVFDEPGVTFIAHELARRDLVRTRARTRIPDLVFSERMVVHLGESEIELNYHGVNNGRGSISMLFRKARVMHVVDWIVIGRMPYKDLMGYDIEGMIRSTEEVLGMDFEVLVGGHGDVGTKEDVRRYLRYLETLYGAVLEGILAGKTVESLQREIRLEEFKDLKMYEEWLPLNVKGVYETLVDESYMLMRPEVPKVE